MELKNGFYTALGTPIENGHIVEDSLRKEIRQQIASDCSGLLLLGSMGMQPSIVAEECAKAAKIAADEVAGRKPLFVGVMDNSIAGVMARIHAMEGLQIAGVVLTTPYYFTADKPALIKYFTSVADNSAFPLFLYDLPVAVKQKITYPMVVELAKHKNIMGIKTADITMILQILQRGEVKKEFTPLYSGLDTVDIGYAHGITHFLDGMFATAPRTAKRMQDAFAAGDYAKGNEELQKILNLRDTMAAYDTEIFSAFTFTMNKLGLEGYFEPDYSLPISDEGRNVLETMLKDMGEI